MSIHLVISIDEKYAIVNALAFYDMYHTAKQDFDSDAKEWWQMCFRADNREAKVVDKLATKIANTF